MVIDEASGTIVMGANVRISTVAIAQGNLTIRVTETPEVSQPGPLSNGTTTIVPRTQVQIDDQHDKKLGILQGSVTLRDLVASLNALGVGPRDLISILQIDQGGRRAAGRPGGALMSGQILPAAAPLPSSTLPPEQVAKIWQAAQDFEAMALGQLLAPMFDTVDTAHSTFGGGDGGGHLAADAGGCDRQADGGAWRPRPRRTGIQRDAACTGAGKMSKELIEAAGVLAETLAEENAALAALDLPRAAAMLAGKQHAAASVHRGAGVPHGAAHRQAAEQLAQRLRSLAAENRGLLERAIIAQGRVIGVIARAAAPAVAPSGYGARGAKLPCRPAGRLRAVSARLKLRVAAEPRLEPRLKQLTPAWR